MLKACFIGHSKVFQEGLDQKVYHQVIALAKEGVQEFYTRNKGNFDAVGIHAVAEAKKESPNLKLYWPAAYYSEVQNWKEYNTRQLTKFSLRTAAL